MINRLWSSGLFVDILQDDSVVTIYDNERYGYISKNCNSVEEATRLYDDIVIAYEKLRQKLKAMGMTER